MTTYEQPCLRNCTRPAIEPTSLGLLCLQHARWWLLVEVQAAAMAVVSRMQHDRPQP